MLSLTYISGQQAYLETQNMQPSASHIIQFKNAIDEIHPIEDACWSEVEPLIYIRELKQNEYFSKEGQQTKEFGLVFKGILRIYYLNDKGEEWNKLFLQGDDFVAASISPEKKSITNIQALEKSQIICIPFPELEKLSQKYSTIKSFIQKLTFSYLEQKQEREISLLMEDAMNNYLDFKIKYPDLENKIQHYHIASYLGITPTQLSRLRRKLNPH